MATHTLKILLDINTILDSLHQRQPFAVDADAVMLTIGKRQIIAYVAAFTVPTLFYLSQREYERNLPTKQAITGAFNDVRSCLTSFWVCDINYAMLQEALRMGGEDYEDNLQVVCAKAYHLDAIITRDKKFPGSTIQVLTPAELLKRLTKRGKRK